MRLKDSSKKLIVLVFCGLLLCSVPAGSACTGIYVGKDVSTDGSAIIARSNDYPDVWGSHFNVTPRVENEPGRFMPVSADGKIKTEIPATTFKYTSTPFMNSTQKYNELCQDAAACTNEYGVSMTMSITAFPNEDALKADPLVEGGLSEFAAPDLVICQSKTAREAVDVLLETVDKYGSSESNIAMIADQNEVWYVEIYTGHQYAAVKMPTDKVSVFGNEYSLEYLSDYEDSIKSKDLVGLAEKKGFAVHGKNKEINLYDTYSGKKATTEYSHMRTWIGHQILAPSNFSLDYNHNAMYPLCFTPDKDVSLQDVCQIFRNRFNGTKYSPDETGRIDMRVIGSETTLSAHAIQVFPDLPAEMSCVSWVSCGPPKCGVFVPLSNDCINASEAYAANQPVDEAGEFDTDHYPYYVFKELNTRCSGAENYEDFCNPVQSYWHEAESNMFDGMSKVLLNAAKMKDNNTRANYITSYCNDMQTQSFEDGKQILNDVIWAQNKNTQTLKLKLDPETHQMTGEKMDYPTIELKLNASHYKNVPKAQI